MTEEVQELAAIKAYCEDWCARHDHCSVADCPHPDCRLWPWRFGDRKQAEEIVAEERQYLQS